MKNWDLFSPGLLAAFRSANGQKEFLKRRQGGKLQKKSCWEPHLKHCVSQQHQKHIKKIRPSPQLSLHKSTSTHPIATFHLGGGGLEATTGLCWSLVQNPKNLLITELFLTEICGKKRKKEAPRKQSPALYLCPHWPCWAPPRRCATGLGPPRPRRASQSWIPHLGQCPSEAAPPSRATTCTGFWTKGGNATPRPHCDKEGLGEGVHIRAIKGGPTFIGCFCSPDGHPIPHAWLNQICPIFGICGEKCRPHWQISKEQQINPKTPQLPAKMYHIAPVSPQWSSNKTKGAFITRA